MLIGRSINNPSRGNGLNHTEGPTTSQFVFSNRQNRHNLVGRAPLRRSAGGYLQKSEHTALRIVETTNKGVDSSTAFKSIGTAHRLRKTICTFGVFFPFPEKNTRGNQNSSAPANSKGIAVVVRESGMVADDPVEHPLARSNKLEGHHQ